MEPNIFVSNRPIIGKGGEGTEGRRELDETKEWIRGIFLRLMESLPLQQIYNQENELSAVPATAKPDSLK